MAMAALHPSQLLYNNAPPSASGPSLLKDVPSNSFSGHTSGLHALHDVTISASASSTNLFGGTGSSASLAPAGPGQGQDTRHDGAFGAPDSGLPSNSFRIDDFVRIRTLGTGTLQFVLYSFPSTMGYAC